MKKIMSMIMAAMVFLTIGTGYVQAQDKTSDSASELPKVYLIKEITPENLVKIYEALGRKAEGKVAVKLSTGEPGGHNFLQPTLIAPLVRKMNGTIVECNTAYGGGRANTEAHLKAAADHGFTAIAKVDIMDADGEVSLPVKGGKHLKEDFVGKNYLNYDFTVVLSHFKGHAMGGFGGAIKNISIGIASSAGKAWIHSAGKTEDTEKLWSSLPAQDDFLESMAEAAKAVKLAHDGVANMYMKGLLDTKTFLKSVLDKEVGLRTGHTSYPNASALALYYDLGGEILTLGSDAHTPEYISCAMEERQELLKDCGLRYFATYDRKKPIFHKI